MEELQQSLPVFLQTRHPFRTASPVRSEKSPKSFFRFHATLALPDFPETIFDQSPIFLPKIFQNDLFFLPPAELSAGQRKDCPDGGPEPEILSADDQQGRQKSLVFHVLQELIPSFPGIPKRTLKSKDLPFSPGGFPQNDQKKQLVRIVRVL